MGTAQIESKMINRCLAFHVAPVQCSVSSPFPMSRGLSLARLDNNVIFGYGRFVISLSYLCRRIPQVMKNILACRARRCRSSVVVLKSPSPIHLKYFMGSLINTGAYPLRKLSYEKKTKPGFTAKEKIQRKQHCIRVEGNY